MEGTNAQMSPFTELAENLSSLSTTCSAGTPRRKVSWSDINSNQTKEAEPSKESGSDYLYSQSSLLRKRRMDTRKIFRSSSISYSSFRLDNTMDKENISSPPFRSPVRRLDYQRLDSLSDAESHDSGFSGSQSEMSFPGSAASSARSFVRSTMFTDEETDDGFMQMLDFDSVDENANFPNMMTNLFTKPISKALCKDEEISDTSDIHHERKRTCRRLSMTPDIPCRQPLATISPLCSSILKEKISNRSHSRSPRVSSFMTPNQKPREYSISENNPMLTNSPSFPSSPQPRSPFKRPEPPEHLSPAFIKRQKRSTLSFSMKLALTSAQKPVLQRCYSESQASIMKAIQKSDEQPDLIGDFSKPYILPMIKGKHEDLKTVSPYTLSQLMKGVYSNCAVTYSVVDCRYPYEFEGGHIKGALNIFTREGILSSLLSEVSHLHDKKLRNIIIFHCEFSSERAPNLYRFLRNQDRECNKESYPQLHHPEIYLLEGGYKAFFESFQDLCEPQKYTPMLHEAHGNDFRHFRAKSKSWSGGQQKKRTNLRIGKKFQVV